MQFFITYLIFHLIFHLKYQYNLNRTIYRTFSLMALPSVFFNNWIFFKSLLDSFLFSTHFFFLCDKIFLLFYLIAEKTACFQNILCDLFLPFNAGQNFPPPPPCVAPEDDLCVEEPPPPLLLLLFVCLGVLVTLL